MHAESGSVGVRLIDLGNCFSLTGTDTSRISFEMQTLPFRSPEVTPSLQPAKQYCKERACGLPTDPVSEIRGLDIWDHCPCDLERMTASVHVIVPDQNELNWAQILPC